MAQLVNDQTDGPFAHVFFSDAEMKQLRYAGLLHDFGKVGVREEVLVKQKKLSPVLESEVRGRFAQIRALRRLEAAERRAAVIAEKGLAEAAAELEAIERELDDGLAQLDLYWQAVTEANVPRVLDEEAADILQEIARQTYVDFDGEERPYLTPRELHFLQIRKGSLDPDERRQIESHVVHSYDFLLNIPWTEELSRVAEIVRGHHEKLDGSGYPDGVTAEHLALETRIMTVCDIFDALTASDRPYKKAMPVEKALQILQWEADDGMLDKDIVKLFVESGVYQKVLEGDWREF
jgi:response regulator RpfG family c-di-GMP phosphodiesterase